jgi:S1-C subfamily serine protease
VLDSLRRLLLVLCGLWLTGLVRAGDLPTLVREVKPSVVLVGTHASTDNPRFNFRGTGFVVTDGLTIVTNAHVLPDAADVKPERSLMVQIWRGGQNWEGREAVLLRLDRSADLALLRIKGTPVEALKLYTGSAPIAEGSDVALMGFPVGGVLGFSHVVHRGIVASVTQLVPPQMRAQGLNAAAVRQMRDGGMQIYQLDATAYPGNSGGPVFDLASGQVIGVLNMVLTKAGREGALSNPTGISYAIPVSRVNELLQGR